MSTYPAAADEALHRLKHDLGKALLADKRAIDALVCANAERETYLVASLRLLSVERLRKTIEVPLQTAPTMPSVDVDTWDPKWPPQSESDVAKQKIDLRNTYQVLPCARCETAGRNRCGSCQGSGQVPDPKNAKKTKSCWRCSGSGTIKCANCAGHGRLMRFPRIEQTQRVETRQVTLPERAIGSPRGLATGIVQFSQACGFDGVAAAREILHELAPSLDAGRATELSVLLAEAPQDLPKGARLGWLAGDARWYAGWSLTCYVGGNSQLYFVPDTSAACLGRRPRDKRKIAGVVAAGLLLVLSVIAFGMWQTHQELQQEQAQREAAVAAQVAAQQARAVQIREQLPSALAQADAVLADAADAEQVVDFDRRLSGLKAARTSFEVFHQLSAVPPEIASREAGLDRAITHAAALKEATANVQSALASEKRADERAKQGAVVEADDLYASAINTFGAQTALVSLVRITGPDGTPQGVDVQTVTADLQKKRERVATAATQERNRVAAETRRQEEAAAAATARSAALTARCGPKPEPDAWDGGISQVERAVKETAHDPDSIDVEKCTTPRLTEELCWVTRCDVRGKNAFGAKVLNRIQFSVSSSGAIAIGGD